MGREMPITESGAKELLSDLSRLRALVGQLERERDRETELRRAAESHVESMKRYFDQVGYPSDWEAIHRDQAEAAEQIRNECERLDDMAVPRVLIKRLLELADRLQPLDVA